MAAPLRRRPEPGEDFEDFLTSPTRSNSEPQLRRPPSPSRTVTAVAPFIPGLKRGGERFSRQFLRDDLDRDEEESPSQALSSMVERLYDEELRKREERRMARTVEREQEFAKQAPFAPRIRAPRRSRNDKVERHLILYDKHLEMAQKRRDKQEQKLRDEQEYLERHSVHKMAGSPRSPQASDAAVYQRLHEEAELKRQRLEQREKAAKTPSSPTRASSMTNMRLFQMASEVAEKRQKLQERKMKEEWDYLQMHSIHRAKSPQADTSRISQRLYEEAEIKKQRLHDMQREKDMKDDKLFATTRRPFDPVSEIPVGEIDGESPSGSGSSSSGGSPSSSFSLATPTAAPKAQVIHNKALDMNVVVIAVIAACGIAGVTLIFVICFNCRSMASIFRKNEQVEKPKFAMAPVLRLHADPGASNSPCCDVEEEQRWLRERQERRPVPRRAASHGPFRRVEPGDSPKAIAESQATRVPGTNQVVPTVTPAAETTEEIVPAPEPAEEIEPSVPTPEQIKAFCQSTEALVSSPLEVAVEAEVSSLEAVEAEAPSMPEQIEAAPAISLPPEKEPSVFPEEPPSISVPTEIEAASISMPTADQIKAFCESTQALVESPIVQGPAPEGSELSEAARRLSLELDECF